ncbi:MAG: glycosyltransferase [Candidatus Omnitrophota bacterium]|nr:MAG: glycosyltransferase [Candidatus Omnitrophota bacterium]
MAMEGCLQAISGAISKRLPKSSSYHFVMFLLNDKTNVPLVSVCLLTYNHEKTIERSIKGVIDQNVKFKMELVIGEDCSTDKTLDICKKYASRYKDIIRLQERKANMGLNKNFLETFYACRRKN